MIKHQDQIDTLRFYIATYRNIYLLIYYLLSMTVTEIPFSSQPASSVMGSTCPSCQAGKPVAEVETC